MKVLFTVILFAALPAFAAELRFDLSQYTPGQSPAGFVSAVTGSGKPGAWKILEEPVPPLLTPVLPLSTNIPQAITQQPVIEQTSGELFPDRSPLLLYTNEPFTDFTLSTRFKILSGTVEPAAALVFRARDQSNYYVLRASARGNLLWYKVVDGISYEQSGIGVLLPMKTGEWHDLAIECTGSGMRCFLGGKLAIPPARAGSPSNGLAINDPTFASGKIGFLTRADTVACFTDTVLDYTPRVPFIQMVANGAIQKYPRLLGLKIFAVRKELMPVIVADPKENDLGAAGTKVEKDVIESGHVYILRKSGQVEVTLPLRDRNGDIIAALRTTMRGFHGETDNTAITRATIIKNDVEGRMENLRDLNE